MNPFHYPLMCLKTCGWVQTVHSVTYDLGLHVCSVLSAQITTNIRVNTILVWRCIIWYKISYNHLIRKHAYSNILKISLPKTESFPIKLLIFFHTSAENIDCGYSLEPPRRGGSNENPQSMFLSRNKNNNVYPCKPQFYHIKVEFKGAKIE